jgi:hypothetical protein
VGTKVEDKLYLGVREQSLNATDLEDNWKAIYMPKHHVTKGYKGRGIRANDSEIRQTLELSIQL